MFQYRSYIVLLLVVLGLAPSSAVGNKEEEARQQRRILNEGYSLLHRDMSRAQYTELILLVKFETDSVEKLVQAFSTYSAQVTNDLERLAEEYPAVRVDLEPLPEMEVRKRFAIAKDRAKDFLPLGGMSQHEFERTMLISMSNGLNHERHLCRVLAAEEPQPELKEFLLKTEQGFDKLYEQTMSLLKRDYFTLDPKGARGG